MIQHVINALLDSKRISEVIILTSPNTPKTSKLCLHKQDIQSFKHPEMVILKIYNIIFPNVFHYNSNKIILTITADLPLITSEIINQVLIEYEKSLETCDVRCCSSRIIQEKWFEAQYCAWRCGSLGIKYIKK